MISALKGDGKIVDRTTRTVAALLSAVILLLLAYSFVPYNARGLEEPRSLPNYLFLQLKDNNRSLSGFLGWPAETANESSHQNTTERVLNFGFDRPVTPATFNGSRLYFSYARHFSSKPWECIVVSQGTCKTEPGSGYVSVLDMAIMEVRARRIFEFIDLNGDGNFSDREPIVKEFKISDFVHPSVRVAGVNSSGGEFDLSFSTNSQIPTWHREVRGDDSLWSILSAIKFWVSAEGGVTFTFSAVLPVRPITADTVGLIRPPEVKVDFAIEGMNFTQPTSLAALDIEVVAYNNSFEFRSGMDFGGIYGDAPLGLAYFSWTRRVVVDGLQVLAGSTVRFQSPSSAVVVFSYPRGQHISHDPVLGVREKAVSFSIPIRGLISPLGLYITIALGVPSLMAIERRLERRHQSIK